MNASADEPTAPMRTPRRIFPPGWLSWLLLIIGVASAAYVAWCSVSDVETFGGRDLRARLVAARAILLGLDPYFIPDGPPGDTWLYDPGRTLTVSANIANSPIVLMLYEPMARVPYLTQRVIWAVVEWAALLATIGVCAATLWRAGWRGRPLAAMIGLFLAAFAGSYAWRLHIERSQYYVFVAFVLSLVLYFAQRRPAWAGLLVGLFVAARPPALLAVPLLFFARQRRLLLGAAAGLLLAIVVVQVRGPVNIWVSYVRCVSAFSRIYDDDFRDRYRAVGPRETRIEGADLGAVFPSRGPNQSVVGWGEVIAKRGHLLFNPARLQMISQAMLVLWSLALTAVCWRNGRSAEPAFAILLAMMLWTAGDYLLPYRYPYNDVVLLPLVAAFAVGGGRAGIRSAVALCGALIVAGAFTHLQDGLIPTTLPLGSLLTTLATLGICAGFTVGAVQQRSAVETQSQRR